MGLFDSDMSLLGLGLLSAAGPSPLGVRQGIGQGLITGRSLMEDARKSRAETRRAQLAEEKFRFEMEQARQAQLEAERRQAAMAQFRETLPEGMRGLFDIAPGPVAQGLLGQMLPSGDTPASYQEYQLAQRNGYQGSFTDFLTQVKRSPGVSVTVGGESKPLGREDAQALVDANGAPVVVRPGESLSDVAQRVPGVRWANPGEEKSRDTSATLEGRMSTFEENLAAASRRFSEVSKRWEAAPFNPALRQEMADATASLESALAQRNNPTGEPSDVLLRKFNIPGPFFRQMLKLFGFDDPAKAYMPPESGGLIMPQPPAPTRPLPETRRIPFSALE